MKARTKPPLADGTCGLIPLAEMFDRVLPGRLVIDFDLPFEERVERALRHIEVTRFTEDEYVRMREALVMRITSDKREEP